MTVMQYILNTRIILAKLHNDAGILGAALLEKQGG